jgi:beta-lactamase class A
MSTTPYEHLLSQIEAEVKAYPGRVGVAARIYPAGAAEPLRVDLDAAHPFPTASAIKTAILAELYLRAEEGRLDLADTIKLTPYHQVGGSGMLKHFFPGDRYSLRNLAMLMMIWSDNTATNMLAEHLGIRSINERMDQIGFPTVELRAPIEFSGLSDGYDFAVAAPSELCELMLSVVRGGLVGPTLTREMAVILARNQGTDRIPRPLPYSRPYSGRVLLDRMSPAYDLVTDPLLGVFGATSTAEGPGQVLYVGNKGGTDPGIRTDCAVIALQGALYGLAVMTEGAGEPEGEHPGLPVIRRISQMVYAFVLEQAGALND